MPFTPHRGTQKKTFFKFIIAVVIAGPAFILLSHSVTAPVSKIPSAEITIDGDDVCIANTKDALALLEEKAPDAYTDVQKYIGLIQCVPSGSGMHAEENPPRFVVGDATRDSGVVWYAGAIVHDATHSKLYHEYKQSHTGAVPSDVWTGRAAESTAIDAQYAALQKIGAKEEMLQYLKNTLSTNYWENTDRKW